MKKVKVEVSKFLADDSARKIISNSRIEIADAVSWLRRQPVGSFDVFVFDPPYGVNFKYASYDDSKPLYEHLYEQLHILTLAYRALKPGGSIWYLAYPEMAADIWAHASFANRHEILTWVYHTHTGGNPLRKATRTWLWLSKGQPKVNRKALEGEYRNPADKRVKERIVAGFKPNGLDWMLMEQVKNVSREKRNFPCQIPQAMVERLILATTDTNDLVGDCFVGSGTTALAAIKLGRLFTGCDLDGGTVQAARLAVESAIFASNSKSVSNLGLFDKPALTSNKKDHPWILAPDLIRSPRYQKTGVGVEGNSNSAASNGQRGRHAQ